MDVCGVGRLLLAGIVVTLVIEVPALNKQVVVWQAGAMPAGWRALRDRWWRFHVVRSGMGVGAFMFCGFGVGGVSGLVEVLGGSG